MDKLIAPVGAVATGLREKEKHDALMQGLTELREEAKHNVASLKRLIDTLNPHHIKQHETHLIATKKLIEWKGRLNATKTLLTPSMIKFTITINGKERTF